MSQYGYPLGKDLNETVMDFFGLRQAFLESRRQRVEYQGGSRTLAVGEPKT